MTMTASFRSKNKYHAKKVTVNGITYDSRKEARRHARLLLEERAGKIRDLRRQVKFVLIPAQREPDTVGPRGGVRKGTLLERECAYIADFVYREKIAEGAALPRNDSGGWRLVVEDTKGVRTKDYIIKRKLMLWVHGIRIEEI